MSHRIAAVHLLAYKEALRAALQLPDRTYFDSWSTNMKRDICNHIRVGNLTLEDAVSRVHHMHINKRREILEVNGLRQPRTNTTKKATRP
jgi:hypothetical protein